MKFQLFKGVVTVLKQLKSGKETFEKYIFNVIGRCLFNYQTFYAIRYTIEQIDNIKQLAKLDKEKKSEFFRSLSSSEKSKLAGIVLTVFDLILCGTKSSWCSSLKPIQRITFVLPIFAEMGDIIFKVKKGLERKNKNISNYDLY